jgi:hypothetical protein
VPVYLSENRSLGPHSLHSSQLLYELAKLSYQTSSSFVFFFTMGQLWNCCTIDYAFTWEPNLRRRQKKECRGDQLVP